MKFNLFDVVLEKLVYFLLSLISYTRGNVWFANIEDCINTDRLDKSEVKRNLLSRGHFVPIIYSSAVVDTVDYYPEYIDCMRHWANTGFVTLEAAHGHLTAYSAVIKDLSALNAIIPHEKLSSIFEFGKFASIEVFDFDTFIVKVEETSANMFVKSAFSTDALEDQPGL